MEYVSEVRAHFMPSRKQTARIIAEVLAAAIRFYKKAD